MAERVLEQYAKVAIAEATPNIIATAHRTAKDDIIAELHKRTGGRAAVASGVVVWAVTIMLTVAAVFTAPDWVRALVEHAARSR